MICYVIPVSVANANYSFIHNYELILNVYFILLIILLIGRIVSVHTRDYNELVHTAQIDGLTAVYNKEHTQPAIDEFLRTSRPDALHAFLILDIDKFKNVNDTYGHAVGDKVLQRVGEFLKNQFRDTHEAGFLPGCCPFPCPEHAGAHPLRKACRNERTGHHLQCGRRLQPRAGNPI